MASTKKSSKESIKEYVIIAAGVLVIITMVLYTCVATPLSQDKSQERPLSMIDESGTSFADPENSAVYENREPGEEGSKEAGTIIPFEQLDDRIGAEHTSTSLDMYAPDEQSNSSSTKEEKEVYAGLKKVYEILNIVERVCQKEVDALKEMNAAADLIYNIFLRASEKLAEDKKKYEECNNEYTMISEKKDVISEKIKYCNIGNPFGILTGIYNEYSMQIKEINTLYEGLNNLEKEKKCRDDIYKEALDYKKELENNMQNSRKDLLKYHTHVIEVERKLSDVNKCILENNKKTYARDVLLCLVRGKEAEHFKENEKEIKPLAEIIELHRARMECIKEGCAMLNTMHNLQKDIISAAGEVYSAYKAFDAIKSAGERQDIALNIIVRVLYKVQEELKGCSSKINKSRHETLV
ncbi:hypothetical protein NEAUS07_0563 [Nematocida ausubeli]|nr:hypothetical protein NEAUS07_0563 [Nematocida ausubeli]